MIDTQKAWQVLREADVVCGEEQAAAVETAIAAVGACTDHPLGPRRLRGEPLRDEAGHRPPAQDAVDVTPHARQHRGVVAHIREVARNRTSDQRPDRQRGIGRRNGEQLGCPRKRRQHLATRPNGR